MIEKELPTTPIETFVAAWNRTDAGMLASAFATDADFTAVNGLRASGRELIGGGHDELFRTVFRGTTLAAKVLAVRDLAPGLAAVEAELSFPKGSPIGATRALAHYIARQTASGKWEIIVFRNMVPFERPVSGPVEEQIRREAMSV